MARPGEGRVTGLVLAAGGSSRLGRPKQLLPYRGATLLDHVLDTARACEFHQLLCVVSCSLEAVRFDGVEIVENPAFGEGCSSSIAAGVRAVDPRCELLVLMLGDQPEVYVGAVRSLVVGARAARAPIAACAYDDGRGHPLAFGRSMFGELAALHGDKGVWKLLDRFARLVLDVRVPGAVPRDVDTWADYEAVLSR
jgi:molybdenum cofactor cytidylyltransferase